jgi:hypothetical protein
MDTSRFGTADAAWLWLLENIDEMHTRVKQSSMA